MPENDSQPERADRVERMIGATIAQRVREHRLARRMTVTELAKQVELSKGMHSKIEHAQSAPSIATLAALAAALEVPVTSLLRGLEEEHDAIHVRPATASKGPGNTPHFS